MSAKEERYGRSRISVERRVALRQSKSDTADIVPGYRLREDRRIPETRKVEGGPS
jgi:hypothetical protein